MLEHDVVGPPIHLLAVAAVPLGAWRLPLAFRTVGRAIETDMKVPVMPQPRLQLNILLGPAEHLRDLLDRPVLAGTCDVEENLGIFCRILHTHAAAAVG